MSPPDLYLESANEHLVWDIEVLKKKEENGKMTGLSDSTELRYVFIDSKKIKVSDKMIGVLKKMKTKQESEKTVYSFSKKDCL